jgi:hypothetical protein
MGWYNNMERRGGYGRIVIMRMEVDLVEVRIK